MESKRKDVEASNHRIIANPLCIPTQIAKFKTEQHGKLPIKDTSTDKICKQLSPSHLVDSYTQKTCSNDKFELQGSEGTIHVRSYTEFSAIKKLPFKSTDTAEALTLAHTSKDIIHKQQVKERLEQLQKNTRALLLKNLQQKKRKAVQMTTNEPQELAKDPVKKNSIPINSTRLKSKPAHTGYQTTKRLNYRQCPRMKPKHNISQQLKINANLAAQNNCKNTKKPSNFVFDSKKTVGSDTKAVEPKNAKPIELATNSMQTLDKLLIKSESSCAGNINDLKINAAKVRTDKTSNLLLPSSRDDPPQNPSTEKQMCNNIGDCSDVEKLQDGTRIKELPLPISTIDLASKGASNSAKTALPEDWAIEKFVQQYLFKDKNMGNQLSNVESSSQNHIEHKPTVSIPFWLRPYPDQQIDYYSFVLAVRKKLEVALKQKLILATMNKNKTNNTQEQLPSTNAQINRTLLSQPWNISETQLINNEDCNVTSPRRISTINQSVEPTEQNTYESKTDADDTTVSSSILDVPTNRVLKSCHTKFHESDGGSITPLSLNEIDSLKLSPKTNVSTQLTNNHVQHDQEANAYSESKPLMQESSLTKLLMEFNRSLTEAIRVNEEIKQKSECGIRVPKETSKEDLKHSTEKLVSNESCPSNKLASQQHCEEQSEKSDCEISFLGSANASKGRDIPFLRSSSRLLNNETKELGMPQTLSQEKSNSYKENSDRTSHLYKTYASSLLFSYLTKRANSQTTNVAQVKPTESNSHNTLVKFDQSVRMCLPNHSKHEVLDRKNYTKSVELQHLSCLLKIRESLLIERTKSQIAWLELKKERFKSEGVLLHISAIRKQQRGHLLKMEKNRQEIKRLLQNLEHKAPALDEAIPKPLNRLQAPSSKCVDPRRYIRSINQSKSKNENESYTNAEFEKLEERLLQREQDLSQRKLHAEYLVQWHQRLDRQENKVLKLEQMLIQSSYSKSPAMSQVTLPNEQDSSEEKAARTRMERCLKEIDNSLSELRSLGKSPSLASVPEAQGDAEYVHTTGSKLNKLWRRLTKQDVDKFESSKGYKLCKDDFEKIYKQAKSTVQQMYANGNASPCQSDDLESLQIKTTTVTPPKIMQETKELDFVDYCSCNAQDTLLTSKSIGSESNCMFSANREISERNKHIERSKQKFLSLCQNAITKSFGLHRSLSDSKISYLDIAHAGANSTTTDVQQPSSDESIGSSSSIQNVEPVEYVPENMPEAGADGVTNETLSSFSELVSDETYDASSNHINQIKPMKNNDKDISNAHVEPDSEHNNIDGDSYSSKFEHASSEILSASSCTLTSENGPTRASHTQSSNSALNTELDVFSQLNLSENDSRIEDESMPEVVVNLDSTEACKPNEAIENCNAQSINSGSSSDTKSELGNPPQLMPDIINNLDNRRCVHTVNESEKTFEPMAATPRRYVREIPNKPPPPYVPPAPGSPMTTIFPSEERIKSLTFRCTHELFCKFVHTEYVNSKGEKLPSVMDEKITNIYERVILDICRENIEEHKEIITQKEPANFHSSLMFFNPPDRLRCIQNSIYKDVRRCLAMEKTSHKRNNLYSIYDQRNKYDYIGKIIVQELYDDEEQWCHYHSEENEVLKLMIDEMVTQHIGQVVTEVWKEQHEPPQ